MVWREDGMGPRELWRGLIVVCLAGLCGAWSCSEATKDGEGAADAGEPDAAPTSDVPYCGGESFVCFGYLSGDDACPEVMPTDGDECAPTGTSCPYGCDETMLTFFHARCSSHRWSISNPVCTPPLEIGYCGGEDMGDCGVLEHHAGCPATMPEDGEGCVPMDGYCAYGCDVDGHYERVECPHETEEWVATSTWCDMDPDPEVDGGI